jgi:hypothetical protein
MSIWGPGPFDNDDGADWFAELRDEPQLQSIREAVLEVSDPEHIGYHDVADGAEAIAAAEVLAELLGSPGDDPVLTDEHEEVTEALREEIKLEARKDIKRLVQQAVDAIEIVVTDEENSELRQMWEEQPDEMPAWVMAMRTLQQRLRTAAIP